MFISIEHFFSKGLTIAIFILVGNWPDNIEVLMILVSVGRMSSRHSSRRDVGMGSKAQEVGFEKKGANFLIPNSLLHTENKLFFEVAK